MRRPTSKHLTRSLLAGIIIIGGFALIGLRYSESSTTDENLNPSQNTGFVGMKLQSFSVDPNQGTFYVTASPDLRGPSGETLQNGSYAKINLEYSLDVLFGDSLITTTTGTIAGGKSIPLRLVGSVDSYPFDQYKASTLVTVQQRMGFTDESLASSLDLSDPAVTISGMTISSKQVPYKTDKSDTVEGNMLEGVGSVNWDISRTVSIKFLVVLIAVLMISGLVVSILITRTILNGNRPPSMNALAWLAAFLFSLFSIRNQMPGDPPSGVLFDRWVFYPVVFGLVALVTVNVASWITRPDWDMENPIYSVLGEIPDRFKENPDNRA